MTEPAITPSTATPPAAHWPAPPVAGVTPPPAPCEMAAAQERAAKSGDPRDLARYLELRRQRT